MRAEDPASSPKPRTWWRRRAVPLVLQAEAAECGLACLVMVAAAHGHDVDLLPLRQQLNLSSRGVNAEQLLRMAEALQLQGHGLRAEPEHLPGLQVSGSKFGGLSQLDQLWFHQNGGQPERFH